MEGGFVVRVLGPIDVVTTAGEQRIGSRNERAVLAALVLAAGRSVTVDALRDVVWGLRPPPSAEASIHSYVSRLRHVLGRDAIEYTDHSYRLVVHRSQVDAAQFEDLVEQATLERDDPPRCGRDARTALDLWRGSPFGDLGRDEAFELEVLRLEELRVVAMELALGAEIELGRHELAAAELESAVREHPYRERLWHLLAEALRRDGRRIEALRVCDGLRHVLADAGLAPDPELLELEQLIAGGEPRDADRADAPHGRPYVDDGTAPA
jgi:DNA-binding SARP family transcriptional activator